MASKEEQKRRKELLANLKQNQRADKLAKLPTSAENLKALFDYLDEELGGEGCDDTLRLTKLFAESRSIDFAALKQWLTNNGGYCDCEVLANVEEKVEDIL
ncbi:DUF2695 domain-containing protein [Solirubrum puertoriconensis]|uniref:DUF2695 domain-containing protein n=1 Tax=Solirubrum puertoriconensis TaxID=1751427 RepID=A0A9X0HHX7_SOLP1|nr:DUF2695 domain-containing protein [Solirubrum puertoriconensis]KUG06183.1 hypothetical protein ASU33_02100 [Solirubrum puertoriconensis]